VGRVIEGLGALYADFPLADPDGFADFHVRVHLARGVRRLVRPQALFELDGYRPFAPLPSTQAFALLEWGMNWCVYGYAHQFLVFHGAVLEGQGGAVLLPAPAGSGKSTLCAALMQRGWRLLSDELVLYEPTTGWIRPLARPVSLKNASIDLMRGFAPQAYISAPMPDTAKGAVAHMKPSALSVHEVDRPAVPRWVIFPRFRPAVPTALTPMEPAEVFMGLVENEFNYSLLRRQGFRALADLVDAVDGYRLEYSDLDHVTGELERLTGWRRAG
jgi:hypothetical protein